MISVADLHSKILEVAFHPSRFKFLDFYAVFKKIWPNKRLAPPLALWNWCLLWVILDSPLDII